MTEFIAIFQIGDFMGNKDLHECGFDEATKEKLELLRCYLREWYPVFVPGNKYTEHVYVFDFFCGPGVDNEGNAGSATIIYEEALRSISVAYNRQCTPLQITLCLSDFDNEKIIQLRQKIETFQKRKEINVRVECLEFSKAFKNSKEILADPTSACLVFIDPYGVKFFTPEQFRFVTKCPKTDLLFFFPSSYISRFAHDPNLVKHIPFDRALLQTIPHADVHRFICNEYFKKLIPKNVEYYLAPFSLKKKSNIYGLVFGSSHLLGVCKFLETCWSKDELSGEANFNKYDDFVDENDMFYDPEEPTTKIQLFVEKLLLKLSEKEMTNIEMIQYLLENGFVSKVIKNAIKKLKNENRIDIVDINTQKSTNHQYLNYRSYGKESPKVIYRIVGRLNE